MEKLCDKFLRYVSFDTMSDENSASQPSTEKQLVLLKNLLIHLKKKKITYKYLKKNLKHLCQTFLTID